MVEYYTHIIWSLNYSVSFGDHLAWQDGLDLEVGALASGREQRPGRSSEALPAGPESPGCSARPGPNRGHASCCEDGTSRVAPARHHEGEGNQPGLSELLRSSQLREHKDPRGPVYPLSVLGFFLCFFA